MSARARRTWFLFACSALAGLAVLVVLTRQIVHDERGRRAAEVERDYHEDLRAALTTMDLRLTPLLARGMGRLESQAEGEPSADPVVLQLDLETGDAQPGDPLDEAFIDELTTLALEAFGEERVPGPSRLARADEDEAGSWRTSRGTPRSNWAYDNRYGNNVTLNGLVPLGAGRVAGPLVPRWETTPPAGSSAPVDPSTQRLVFARIVRIVRPTGIVDQLHVFRVDWAALAANLVPAVREIFPEATLMPVIDPSSGPVDRRLASVPAVLITHAPAAPGGVTHPTRVLLGSVWLVALAAFASIGFSLRSSLAHGERHRRFTSAVTHELRTPLTTFRLYSEMLARGMVPEAARAEYLATLEAESARMAGLVENVLAYARLEEGRGPVARESLTAGALVERVRPVLERRCATDDVQLAIDLAGHDAALITTDPDAVGQILLNLVDNACKYGCPAPGARIHVSAAGGAGQLDLRIRDEGPGVPADLAQRVFRPFERAGRDESDPAPGVGLGLALARDLARTLGGELGLEPSSSGATFRLRLPLAR